MFGFAFPVAFFATKNKKMILMLLLGVLVVAQLSLTRVAVTYVPLCALLCVLAASQWKKLRYVLCLQIVFFVIVNCFLLHFYITGQDTPFNFTQRYLKENLNIHMFKRVKGLEPFDDVIYSYE